MCQLMPLSLASVKSRLVLPFWYWPTRVVPEKGPFNGYVCVCVILTEYLAIIISHYYCYEAKQSNMHQLYAFAINLSMAKSTL